MAGGPTLLHAAALDDLLSEATRPQRWRSRTALAAACGFTPATLTHAVKGNRGLSDDAMTSLLDVTGWRRESLLLPVRATPGDLATRRLLTAIEQMREQVSRDLLAGTDEIARAITERNT